MKKSKPYKIYNKKRILLIANCTWYLFNFRKELLYDLNQRGYELILLSTLDQYAKYTNKYFFKVNKLFLIRGSENLFFEFFTILNIFYCYLKYKPDLIHNFTIKPTIYGGIVGRALGTKKIINHITGLGPSFFSNRKKRNLINKILYPIYKYSFNNKKTINIFHNHEDRETFFQKNLTSKANSIVIEGSGVDIDHYKSVPAKKSFNKNIQILFPARLIREKGIIELLDACNQLWKENYKFILNIAGERDFQNKTSLSAKKFNEIRNNKNINFIGKSNNMLKVYKSIDIVVLPSWREGLSKSLLEASAMGLPIITTDVPGCKNIITNEYSGLLIPVKDQLSLKKAIKKFLEDEKLAINYGQKARKVVIKKFTTNIINNQILKLYENV